MQVNSLLLIRYIYSLKVKIQKRLVYILIFIGSTYYQSDIVAKLYVVIIKWINLHNNYYIYYNCSYKNGSILLVRY